MKIIELIKNNGDLRIVGEILLTTPYIIYYIDQDGDSLLHIAIKNNNIGAVRILVKHNADVSSPNKSDKTPLNVAIKSGMYEIAKFLVESGAGLDRLKFKEKNYTPLQLAVKNRSKIKSDDNIKFINFLLENGTDINSQNMGVTALHLAIIHDNAPAFRLLLQNGADPKIKTDSEENCLHLIAYGTITEQIINQLIIDQLVKIHKIDIEAKDINKETPLYIAMIKGNITIAETLLENGADVEAKNSEGRTCLHQAVQEDLLEIVGYLIKYHKPNINTKDIHGHTILYDAIMNDNEEIARILLENGANPHIIDEKGRNLFKIIFDKITFSAKQRYYNHIKNLLSRIDIAIKKNINIIIQQYADQEKNTDSLQDHSKETTSLKNINNQDKIPTREILQNMRKEYEKFAKSLMEEMISDIKKQCNIINSEAHKEYIKIKRIFETLKISFPEEDSQKTDLNLNIQETSLLMQKKFIGTFIYSESGYKFISQSRVITVPSIILKRINPNISDEDSSKRQKNDTNINSCINNNNNNQTALNDNIKNKEERISDSAAPSISPIIKKDNNDKQR